MTTSVCIPAQSSTCACVGRGGGGVFNAVEVSLLCSKGPRLMQVCVYARVCETALHALDLQLANKALGPHSCLIVSVHRDPLTHTLTLRHTQRGDLVTATQTHSDTRRHTHTHSPLPAGSSLSQCRRQRERSTVPLGILSSPPDRET